MKLGVMCSGNGTNFESKIINEFKSVGVDVIVLAGWMRIISPKFVQAFPNRIINVHPSLLPKYKGLNVVQRAMEAGESVTGCTVHYVNDELDGGEIIIQREVPIHPKDTIKTLTRKIQLQEYGILPAALEIIKERLGINFCY